MEHIAKKLKGHAMETEFAKALIELTNTKFANMEAVGRVE